VSIFTVVISAVVTVAVLAVIVSHIISLDESIIDCLRSNSAIISTVPFAYNAPLEVIVSAVTLAHTPSVSKLLKTFPPFP
jgi:hypothetical protein